MERIDRLSALDYLLVKRLAHRVNLSMSTEFADVDLLLLNDEEFNQFQHGEPQSVTYELNSAHNEMVDWWIPATRDNAKTYHLIFINSADEVNPKFVQADFTLTFE